MPAGIIKVEGKFLKGDNILIVDKDGNVYHKGVEQPKLKGKRQITDVDAIKKERLAAKEVKRKKETKKLIKMAAEKKELKKAIEAQKDFLNHKFDK